MAALYIGIIMICRVVQAIFSKQSSNEVKNMTMLVGYNGFKHSISAILGILLIIFAGNGFKADFLTVAIATLSGLSLFVSSFCGIWAVKSGTISLSSIFSTAGMIIPIIAGVFLYDKKVMPLQILGLFMFFVSAYLLIGASKKIYTNFSFKTMLLLVGSLVSNGATMLCQELFTAKVPDGDVSVFSFFSFGTIAILTSAMFLVMSKRNAKKKQNDGEQKANGLTKNLVICGLFLAAAVFIINQLATICTKLVSPIVLFTLINGGGTIISTIVAAIMYKEKITKRSGIGIIIGVLSLVIIKMFEV